MNSVKQLRNFIIINAIFGYAFAQVNTSGLFVSLGAGYGNNAAVEKIGGGYMFGQNFGLETDYTFWGQSSSNLNINSNNYTYSLSPQSWDGLLVLSEPLGGLALSAHIKFGVSYIWLNNSSNNLQTSDSSGLTSALGLGISLTPWKNISLSLDYMNYGLVNPINIQINSGTPLPSWTGNNVTINLGYAF